MDAIANTEAITKPDETYSDPSSGWASIENHFQEHDNTAPKSIDEDINTAIVFAGLFSAVLTAFIIESYQWLQEDYQKTSVALLTYIATTQSNPSNATSLVLTKFKPEVTDICVNVLWFLGLAFSLSSSIFAFLVKQWMREYRQWHSPLSSPRENVRLCQLRHNAWLKWRVQDVIGLVPTFLECALGCFTLGSIILLWTLHRGIAAIMSSVVAFIGLLLVSMAFSPMFDPHSPFKTWDSWWITCFVDASSRFLHLLKSNKLDIRQWLRETAARPPAWRHRELSLAPQETARALGLSIPPNFLSVLKKDDIYKYAIDTVTLIEALSWAFQGSLNDTLAEPVAQCISTIHSITNPYHRLIIDLYAAKNWFQADLSVCHVNGITRDQKKGSFISRCMTMFKATPTLGVGSIVSESQYPSELPAHYSCEDMNALDLAVGPLSIRKDASHLSAQLFIDLVLQDTGTFLDSFLGHHTTMDGSRPSRDDIRLLIWTLSFLSNTTPFMPSERIERIRDVSVNMYNRLSVSLDENNKSPYPGLRAILFKILFRLGRVELSPSGDAVVNLDQKITTKYYARVALQTFYSNDNFHNTDDCHTFVILVDHVFQNIHSHYHVDNSNDDNDDPLQHLSDVCAKALDFCIHRGWKNCGSYSDLPWISTLAAQIRLRRGTIHLTQTLYQKLGTSLYSGLLTGPRIWSDFTELTTFSSTYISIPERLTVMTTNSIPVLDAPTEATQLSAVPYHEMGRLEPTTNSAIAKENQVSSRPAPLASTSMSQRCHAATTYLSAPRSPFYLQPHPQASTRAEFRQGKHSDNIFSQTKDGETVA